jgi:uncharacterized phage-associated protein
MTIQKILDFVRTIFRKPISLPLETATIHLKGKDMASIKDVSDYVILRLTSEGNHDLNTLKHQKLLYYIQAWHLAFFDKPMFSNKFQAWVHGPVNRSVYDQFKDEKGLYSLLSPNDVSQSEESKLTASDIAHIENILETYATFSPYQLETMTHEEDPWILARQGYNEYQRCEEIIDETIMKEYYRKRLV